MLIFPRKNFKAELMDDAPPGSIGKCHSTGWIQSYLFTEWFDHFLHYAKPREDDPAVLILDGHFSHTRNLDVIKKARENNIAIVCLPPHSTHKLQPLDLTFMAPFKTYYCQQIES
ncbi:DDE superfamily endonuclease [Popillia japonica]|uniref:DDE superfamily endonuclease n=1 Tax=Popillia japonica TaxID=7064 RepID=A0AAW1JE19_POPJA